MEIPVRTEDSFSFNEQALASTLLEDVDARLPKVPPAPLRLHVNTRAEFVS
jgi:hypothetical protein